MSNKMKGNAALLFTAMIWGTGFIAQKLGNNLMPPMTFNAVRQLLASIVLCPVMLVNLRRSGYLSREKNTESQLAFKKKKLLIAGTVVGFFFMSASMTQQAGLVTVSAGKSGFITALYIVITPILGIFLGKRVDIKTVVCISAALFGFALLSLNGGLGGATAGDWLTLCCAVLYACHILAVNYFVDKHNDIIISVMQMIFAGIIGIIIALILEDPTWAQIVEAMPLILYSTLFPTALGFTLQIVGQKYTDATTAALLMSLESVFAVICGAIFLKESMTTRELLGCVIIFTATVLEQIDLREIKAKKQKIQ